MDEKLLKDCQKIIIELLRFCPHTPLVFIEDATDILENLEKRLDEIRNG